MKRKAPEAEEGGRNADTNDFVHTESAEAKRFWRAERQRQRRDKKRREFLEACWQATWNKLSIQNAAPLNPTPLDEIRRINSAFPRASNNGGGPRSTIEAGACEPSPDPAAKTQSRESLPGTTTRKDSARETIPVNNCGPCNVPDNSTPTSEPPRKRNSTGLIQDSLMKVNEEAQPRSWRTKMEHSHEKKIDSEQPLRHERDGSEEIQALDEQIRRSRYRVDIARRVCNTHKDLSTANCPKFLTVDEITKGWWNLFTHASQFSGASEKSAVHDQGSISFSANSRHHMEVNPGPGFPAVQCNSRKCRSWTWKEVLNNWFVCAKCGAPQDAGSMPFPGLTGQISLDPEGHDKIRPFEAPTQASKTPITLRTAWGSRLLVTFLGSGLLELKCDLNTIMYGPHSGEWVESPQSILFFGEFCRLEKRKEE